MSQQLCFWRENTDSTLENAYIYAELSKGYCFDFLDNLPVKNILVDFKKVFSSWKKADASSFSKGEGLIQVFTSKQFVRFDCYSLSIEDLNAIIDLMLEYGCPLYDPNIDVRFA